MPGDPGWGRRGEARQRAAARRGPRLIGTAVVLLILVSTASFGYDRRSADLSRGWVALPDGRTAILDPSGFPGPASLVILGRSSVSVRPLPPVLRRSTSIEPARRAEGLRLSRRGWVLMRLGRLGHDTSGGQITEVSPSGELLGSYPLLQWRNASVVGITDDGVGVFRKGSTLYTLGRQSEGVPFLGLSRLGVNHGLTNLAGMALAPDGRLAVLVGRGSGSAGYRLFLRHRDGSPDRDFAVPRGDLFDTPAADHRRAPRPAVGFDGSDVIVAGDAGLLRFHRGQAQAHVKVSRPASGRLHLAPTLVALHGQRWVIGRDPSWILDASGHLHQLGFGPCPSDRAVRSRCPAMFGDHRIPRPDRVLPPAAVGILGLVLIALAWAGRVGRTEAAGGRLGLTTAASGVTTAWLAASLSWGSMHGSAPLVLLLAMIGAILGPAFPKRGREEWAGAEAPSARHYEPWVSDRIAGRSPSARARLEVIPIPSRPIPSRT